jgi:membrane peptidoglycan carboxypeptidase
MGLETVNNLLKKMGHVARAHMLLTIAGAVVIGLVSGTTYWLSSVQLPQIAPSAQSSQILAYDGQVIATLHGTENRTIVPLDKISPYLQIAVLSAEDRGFYKHSGFSLRGTLRAARANMEGGRIIEGGSTITQQYVRRTLPEVGTEKTLMRKLKEIFWAFELERHYSKAQIMERYLNTVYFGRGAYGAEAAARAYFKIPAADLSPGQGAYLAGLIRSPMRYQLDRNPEGAVKLRNEVVDGMVAGGFLGPGEGRAAKAEDLRAQFKPGMSIEVDSPRAGYFVEYVRRQLKSQFKLTDEEILGGGLQIHTTLDLRMQDAAESAIKSTLTRADDPEAAMVAMDPQGRVRAMVGGRVVDSIDRARGYNFAVDDNGNGGGRPAGSAFKPIALTAFIEEGKSLDSRFSGGSPIQIDSDQCRNGDGTPWEVSNYSHAQFGSLDVVGATTSSVNTIYAQIMDKVVTPTKFIETAVLLGIDIPSYDKGCALTLGTTDVTPLEMARAYTTFGQRGERPEPLIITKITHPDGSVVAELTPKTEQTIDPNVADTVNYVLEKNIQSGTGTGAKIGRPAAGKTGTTQNFQNAWFAGYTPEMTAVVWMGYPPGPDGKIPGMLHVHGRQVNGGSFPATIWKKFMSSALDGIKATDFHEPKLGGEVVHAAPPPGALQGSDAFNPFGSSGPPSPPDAPEPPPPPFQPFQPCFPFCG